MFLSPFLSGPVSAQRRAGPLLFFSEKEKPFSPLLGSKLTGPLRFFFFPSYFSAFPLLFLPGRACSLPVPRPTSSPLPCSSSSRRPPTLAWRWARRPAGPRRRRTQGHRGERAGSATPLRTRCSSPLPLSGTTARATPRRGMADRRRRRADHGHDRSSLAKLTRALDSARKSETYQRDKRETDGLRTDRQQRQRLRAGAPTARTVFRSIWPRKQGSSASMRYTASGRAQRRRKTSQSSSDGAWARRGGARRLPDRQRGRRRRWRGCGAGEMKLKGQAGAHDQGELDFELKLEREGSEDGV
jgi:hypothetical protein